MEDKEKIEKIIDELYSCYEAEISLQNVRWNTAFQVLYNYISKQIND
jgi:uncharacterized protein YecT (DUF1311 family)